MTEDMKIEKMKEILSQYATQHAHVEWQRKKLDGLKKIITDDETEPEDDYLYSSIKGEYESEKDKLCDIYTEIMDMIDLVPDIEQREILFSIYIDLYTQDEVAYRRQVHVKTIGRKHRSALITMYDALYEDREIA